MNIKFILWIPISQIYFYIWEKHIYISEIPKNKNIFFNIYIIWLIKLISNKLYWFYFYIIREFFFFFHQTLVGIHDTKKLAFLINGSTVAKLYERYIWLCPIMILIYIFGLKSLFRIYIIIFYDLVENLEKEKFHLEEFLL